MVAIDSLESLVKDIRIDIAENGVEAIEKIKINNYDVVLMDIQMPVMDGYQATVFIRKELDPPLNKIKIIAMTANALPAENKKCFDVGMNDYVSKPFDPTDLVKKINKAMET